MNLIDSGRYITNLNIVDEFGGRGDSNRIKKFYISLKVTDAHATEIELSKINIIKAVLDKKIIITNYMGNTDYTLGILDGNPEKSNFIVSDVIYKLGTNIITIDVGDFYEDASISVRFKTDGGGDFSTCYLSDFPSYFFLSKYKV